ncbi:hypothetical protein EHS19_08955, partial [Bifidobacterium jacchi]
MDGSPLISGINGEDRWGTPLPPSFPTRRVPVIVATPDRPTGGTGGQVVVRGRGVRDEVADVRG